MGSGVRWNQGQFDEAIASFGRLVPTTIKAAALASALRTAKHAHDTKFIKANPPYLDRQTGRAARSIAASPHAERTPNGARATWGSNVDYVIKHERGGTYREWQKGHFRGPYLRHHYDDFGIRMNAGALEVKRHFVRGHFVFKLYRRREMIRTAAGEMRSYPGLAARAAMQLLIDNEKPPTAQQVITKVGG